ncbi:MAG: ankyrin repeat domain-containing protein [Parachlamydiales bacterium]|nr:ankyrin repeat domain-containing protein [Parachlamydiales bacterium]
MSVHEKSSHHISNYIPNVNDKNNSSRDSRFTEVDLKSTSSIGVPTEKIAHEFFHMKEFDEPTQYKWEPVPDSNSDTSSIVDSVSVNSLSFRRKISFENDPLVESVMKKVEACNYVLKQSEINLKMSSDLLNEARKQSNTMSGWINLLRQNYQYHICHAKKKQSFEDWLKASYKLHEIFPTTNFIQQAAAQHRLNNFLSLAIENNNERFARNLIKAGAQVTSDLLKKAIELNLTEMVTFLLTKELNPNSRTLNDTIDLTHYACQLGAKVESTINILIKHKADFEISADTNMPTAVFTAINSDLSNNTIISIINTLKNIDAVNIKNESLVHLAVQRQAIGRGNEVLVHLLCKGANPNTLDLDGNSPLHLACQLSDANALKTINLMLIAEADPMAVNTLNQTPLHIASLQSLQNVNNNLKDNPKIVESLILSADKLKQNWLVNLKDCKGQTALHYGLDSQGENLKSDNNCATIQSLIDFGATIEAKDDVGNTPLHYAVQALHVDHVKLLIKNGANPKNENNNKIIPARILVGEEYKTSSYKKRADILDLLTKIE